MSDLKRVSRLKEQLDSVRAEVERARGSLDSTLKRVSEEFGCASLVAAEEKLDELKRTRDHLARRLKKSTRRFERKWKDLLR